MKIRNTKVKITPLSISQPRTQGLISAHRHAPTRGWWGRSLFCAWDLDRLAGGGGKLARGGVGCF